ncbi:sugar ABC transporter ATP-binding protein [Nocardia sp. 348MFTsu5.1]|uniref:sugar ABC transporter ATP-binding protein n=1 Tax=Nocardia sp. 348MFTsu5.1 TaxID=1172185 RepID=UPI00036B4F0C|nr:sugar ABC transporter ATP-binding protein [Nocardia sp. 348MFTsu5.1]
MTLALDAQNVSKSFPGGLALACFSLQVKRGEVHALVGENGSGKSTFIKVLSGYHNPDPGAEIYIGGEHLETGSAHSTRDLGCRFVHQDVGLIETETVLDNLYLDVGFPTRFGTIRTRAARNRASEILAEVGLDIDPRVSVSTLTPAMKTGVAVARAIREDENRKATLLVLDEPTATLPDDEVQQLLKIVRHIASAGVGVIYVTHRLDEVFEIAQNITILRDGNIVDSVPCSDLNRKQLVNLLVGSEFDEAHAETEAIRVTNGEVVLQVRDLEASAVDDVSFDVAAGSIVGIAGITGSGREAILGSIYGANRRYGGEVDVAGKRLRPMRPDLATKAGVAYIPPDRRAGAVLTLSAAENVSLSNLAPLWDNWRISPKRESAETTEWFDDLDVRPRGGEKRPLSTFSGGNQQKLIFAKWLRRNPVLFLLDEPTQGVDIAAKSSLHHQLIEAAAGGAAVVVSSSDVDELASLCHRVIVLKNGRITADLSGPQITVPAISHAALGEDAPADLTTS